jgi:predicted type IV restriction endonuclease
LLPTLQALGWPVFDTSILIPQFAIEGRRVDYALCDRPNHPVLFVEVKKTGQAEGADKQLFENTFHKGIQLALLKDGREWHFYLPGEVGEYYERRVYKLDIIESDPNDSAKNLQRYLEYKNVCSGKALEAAREDYKNVYCARP